VLHCGHGGWLRLRNECADQVHLSGTLWDRLEFWNWLWTLQRFTLPEWWTWNRGLSQNWRPPSKSVWLAFLFFFLFYPCSYACCKVLLSPELCRGRTGVQGHDWKRWGRNSGKRNDLCRMAIRVFNISSKLWSRRVIRSVSRFGPRVLLLIAVALARLTTRGQQLHSLLCFFTRPPSPPTSSPPCRLLAIWMWFLDASFFAFFLQFSVVHDCQGDIHVENGSSADCIGDEGSLISYCFRNAVYNFLNSNE
jgi:hypothetical protein